jgi:uncharacterized protein (DUF2141 family)
LARVKRAFYGKGGRPHRDREARVLDHITNAALLIILCHSALNAVVVKNPESMAMRTAIAIALVVGSMIGAISITPQADDVAAANSIKVVVEGFHSNSGEADCVLFGSPEGFPSDSKIAMKRTKSKIVNNQAVCAFTAVAAGEYAVSVFHDENANGVLDRNFIGMPKEGVGASNDAAGKLGPPKFEDARFSYKGGQQTLTIHLRYLLAPM